MPEESSLVVDLDGRVSGSPRFSADTVGGYFTDSTLRWWRPDTEDYDFQGRRIAEWLAGETFETAVELGPGFGRITGLIEPVTTDLTLVETNKKAIGVLQSEFPDVDILQALVEEYGLWAGAGKYDLVAAVELLVHIPNIPELLDNVAQSLKVGGRFITSITPDTYYTGRPTYIHRGINRDEFEHALGARMTIEDAYVYGEHVTYLAAKNA